MNAKLAMLYIMSGTAGASSFVVLGREFNEAERALAMAVVVLFALIAGSMARQATIDPANAATEKRRTVMIFGALYIIALSLCNSIGVDLYGAGMIAVGVGAAGPLVLVPLQEGVVRAIQAFFKR